MIIERLSGFVYTLRIKQKELYEFFYYRRLKRQLKSSSFLKQKYCNACGYCCRYSVCQSTPDELKIIAEYVNLDPVDFILEKCAFAHFHEEKKKKTVCIVYPRFLTKSICHKAGTQLYSLDFFDTKGCIFLIEYHNQASECAIYPVRPEEAKLMKCWQSSDHNEPIRSWDNDVLTSQFEINIQRDTDNP